MGLMDISKTISCANLQLALSRKLHKIAIYVGTADYALPNCPPGYYNSLIISRPGYEISEIKNCTFGYNEKMSHSGWTAPMAHFRKLNISPKFLKKQDHTEPP